MPTYDYQCQDCEEIFEVFHGMMETPKNLECSSCKSGKVDKMISGGSAVHFKGYGFPGNDMKRSKNEGTSSE
jgi:putative FmdB family regulatory protein